MSPRERWWRRHAEWNRATATTFGRHRRWLNQQAREADHHADLIALDGFTLDEPSGWSVVAALAGEGA